MKGILLDYIEGCGLEDIGNHFPRSCWLFIVDEALRIVRTMDKMCMLNEDVALRNFVVSRELDSVLDDSHGET